MGFVFCCDYLTAIKFFFVLALQVLAEYNDVADRCFARIDRLWLLYAHHPQLGFNSLNEYI